MDLKRSYGLCKELNRRYGKTYYYSTLILPKSSRPHVHALYGFCRYVDDIVDDLGPVSVENRAAAVDAFEEVFFSDLQRGASDDSVLMAVVDTISRFDIDPDLFRRFLRSMKMDFHITRYGSFEDLLDYMDGSAAVIGEMMMPILSAEPELARGPARDLGIAFQLTNFLRDVGEDLLRGRIYIPTDDIDRFGAWNGFDTREPTAEFRALMEFEIARTLKYYESSLEGDRFLTGSSRHCIQAARELYGGILAKIKSVDYDVFSKRAKVPSFEKLATVAKFTIFAK